MTTARPAPRHSTLTLRIILGMALGIALGLAAPGKLAVLGIFGKLLIQLIKAVAVPLVFVSVLDALLATNITWQSGKKLLVITLVNGCIASAIALTLTNLIQPGSYLDFRASARELALDTGTSFADKKLDPIEVLTGHIPGSIFQPFLDNDVIGVVLMALLLGVAARQLSSSDAAKKSVTDLHRGTRFMISLFEKILGWLVLLTPIAVFGVTVKTVGEHGLAPFSALSLYVAVGFAGFLIQILIVYQLWIAAYAKIPLRRFWSEAKEALIYAAGTNSSLATLPLTLATLDRLGISYACSRLGACIGTNLNNDGIILYEAMAVLFVAQACGIDLSITSQIMAVMLSLFAALGVAGIPEAGIISLSLVLSAVGLPLEILPLLLTVDWVIARGRSVTNVLADLTVSVILDAEEKRTVNS